MVTVAYNSPVVNIFNISVQTRGNNFNEKFGSKMQDGLECTSEMVYRDVTEV